MSKFSQLVESNDYKIQQDKMWKKLYNRQVVNLKNKAHSKFFRNLNLLDLPSNCIPDLNEVTKKLSSISGWSVVPVEGLIGYKDYFSLLAEKKFPVATFIRDSSQEVLSKDPDLFHELFGHCVMLCDKEYSSFFNEYGKFALTVPHCDRPMFARLIWFTTETGLIQENGLKIIGGSILSSYKESNYCFSKDVIRKNFNIVSIFREPYRADILQKVYYVMDSFEQIYNILQSTSQLFALLSEARELGEYPLLFPMEVSKYSNIGHCVPLVTVEDAGA